MNSIEENNREQIISLGQVDSSQMTKREKIATEVMASLAGAKWASAKCVDEGDIEDLADLSVKMADGLIKRLARR